MRELTEDEISEVSGGVSVSGSGFITYNDQSDHDEFTISAVYTTRTLSNDGIMSFQSSEVVSITSRNIGGVGTIQCQGTTSGSGSANLVSDNTIYNLTVLGNFGGGGISVSIGSPNGTAIGQIEVTPGGFSWMPSYS